jgi:hypothetical protein
MEAPLERVEKGCGDVHAEEPVDLADAAGTSCSTPAAA